jgi:acetoin utilization deacetylase AcuC-like enzyme
MGVTGLVQDERFLMHRTGPGHPERPDRLIAIRAALESSGLRAKCRPISPVPADLETIQRVHEANYVERLRRACESGRPFIDVPDSVIVPESYEVALLAAGAAVTAVDEAMAGRISNAFCAVRPPGHHAERHMSMGFCLFNNVAIAAQHLLDHHALSRVLVFDWDVHHGNGTQHIFESDPRVLFISLHAHPGILYPGTGYERERGISAGTGFTLNCPMLPPAGDDDYRSVLESLILPAMEAFRPEFVLVSAGFDAHRDDPIGPLELSTECFGWMTDALTDVARRHAAGRLVSCLEGGYNLRALAESVTLHVSRLLAA